MKAVNIHSYGQALHPWSISTPGSSPESNKSNPGSISDDFVRRQRLDRDTDNGSYTKLFKNIEKW